MKSKRLLSIVLAVMLVLGLAPAMTIPVKAAGNGKAIQMGGGAIAAGDTVYYGSAGKPWRVLSLNGSGGTYSDGTNSVAADSALFLFSKEALFQTAFHDSENNYTNSTLRAELNSRISDYFTAGEESALLNTTKDGGSIRLAESYYSDPGLGGDRLFALSANELQAYLGYSDAIASWTEGLSGLDWWLRSAWGDNSREAGAVYSDGLPLDLDVGDDYGWARPAFNLNLNSVLFTSAAAGGKSSGAVGADALASVGTYAGSEWKVTLKGLTSDFNISYCAGTYNSETGAITVKYTGAAGNYISAVVTDSSGQTIKKYGKIASVSGAEGEVTINTSGKMDAGDRLFVFCEQDNGDNRTDYASELKEITLPPTGHVWKEATCTEPKTCTICGATEGSANGHSFTYALSEDQKTITATCSAENCPSGYHENGIAVTLNAPENLMYDGTAKEAAISGYPDSAVPKLADKPNIVYYKSTGSGSTEPDGDALAGAPKDAGNYVAQITWGEKTASAAFTITRNVISYQVTFIVTNGSWDDKSSGDKTVTLSRYEDEDLALVLKDTDIPAVGNEPAEHYKAGSWDVTPSTETEITKDTTYTYTYAEKAKINRTVTFKVVNGSWDDEKTEDVVVTLNGEEGDVLKLSADQIPAVGNKPDDAYKAGSWDTEPNAETAITTDMTYTYTYAKKDTISAKVTFKVVNGAWDEGEGEAATADKTVTLTGYEGDTLKLSADQIPAVGNKPDDAYKAGSWDTEPGTETAITTDTTYTYTYAKKETISAKVTFKVVNGAWDDEKTEDVVVTLNGYEGDTLKLSTGQIPAVGNKPAEHYKAGEWDVTPGTETAITEDTTYTYTYAEKAKISQTVTFKVVNGAWDDEKTEDVVITLNGEEGDVLKLSADQIPAVGNKPAENYMAGSWDTVPDTTTAITKDTTYTYTYAQKPVYNVIEGANGKVTKNSGKGLTFKTDGDYAKFTGIKIDDKNVASSLYTAKSGSTIVELKAACIDQLSVGKHTIQFLYTDGSCETTFEVQQAVTPTKTPTATPTRTPGKSNGTAAKTGDTSNTALWLLLMGAAAGFVLTLVWRRRAGRN